MNRLFLLSIYVLTLSVLNGCGTVKKLFTKEKSKTEITETIKSEEVSTIDTHSDSETFVFTETEIKDIFSELDFTFTGIENEDQAEIQLTKTKEGITVKVTGKATTTFNQKESKTKANETTTVNQSENVHSKTTETVNSEKQTTIKEKTKTEEKSKWKVVFEWWVYLVGLSVVLVGIYLYRKLKR